jgi:hypothetical protein
MAILAMMALLIGAALSARFKVLIVIPATLAVVFLVIVASAAAGRNGASALLLIAVFAGSCLQLGYLVGYIGRVAVGQGLRASKPPLRAEAAR